MVYCSTACILKTSETGFNIVPKTILRLHNKRMFRVKLYWENTDKKLHCSYMMFKQKNSKMIYINP